MIVVLELGSFWILFTGLNLTQIYIFIDCICTGISGITINCKDYSKKRTNSESNKTDSTNGDQNLANNSTIPSPTGPKQATKIRLKKPNHIESSSSSVNSKNSKDSVSAHVRTVNQIEAASTSGDSVSDNKDKMETEEEVPKKKFKRIDVKFP